MARWLTPNETWVHNDGLSPDFFIPLPDPTEAAEGEELTDTQLDAAIDYLQGEQIESIPPADENSEASE